MCRLIQAVSMALGPHLKPAEHLQQKYDNNKLTNHLQIITQLEAMEVNTSFA